MWSKAAGLILRFDRWHWLNVILAGIVLFLLLQRFGYLLPSPDARPPKVEERGTFAPDFQLSSLKGKEVRLSSFRGRVVLISFWATWCPPCRAEMPSMQKLYDAFKDRGFTILAVSSDRLGRDVVEPFMREYGLTFSALIDPRGKVGPLFRVPGIPTNFVLDKHGRIAYQGVGPRDWNSFSSFRLIEKLLAEPYIPFSESRRKKDVTLFDF